MDITNLPQGYIYDDSDSIRIITPYADPNLAIKTFLNFALQKDAMLRTMIYGCTLPVFFDAFIEAKKVGCDIKIIFDHTQAEGKAEKQQIEKLIENGFIDSQDFLIGTSPKHNIVHLKQTTIKYGDNKYITLEGSWNYSKSATAEMNMLTFTSSIRLAEYTLQVFSKLWQWILENESQYQKV